MANAVYPLAKQAFLQGNLDLDDDVRAILVDLADYTYSAAHEFLSSVPVAAREETSTALTGKTFTNGVFDSDNPSFPGAVGDPCEAIILYQHTGSDATARLIAFFDTGVTGLPVTPNSGDINVTVNASGWFAL
jgi:hypothetical protein